MSGQRNKNIARRKSEGPIRHDQSRNAFETLRLETCRLQVTIHHLSLTTLQDNLIAINIVCFSADLIRIMNRWQRCV